MPAQPSSGYASADDPPTTEPGILRHALVVIVPIIIVQQLSGVSIAVLGPDLEIALHLHNASLLGIATVASLALVLGAAPVAWLADRTSRRRIVAVSSLLSGAALVAAGFSANSFQFFWALTALSGSFAFAIPVFASLITDLYPISSRGRAFAVYSMAQPAGLVAAPFVVGLIAHIGGPAGWRDVYLVIAAPTVLLGIVAGWTLPEPPRGQQELALIGRTAPATISSAHNEERASLAGAYQRLKKIRTFLFMGAGVAVLGFALVTIPIQLGLLLRDSYGYGPFTRGWMTSLTWTLALVAIPVSGVYADRAFGQDPRRVIRTAGYLIVAFGVCGFFATRFDSVVGLIALLAVANACTGAAFVGLGPIVGAVAPYRLRAQAFALVPIVVFLGGGMLGGLIIGALSDAYGPRAAIAIAAPIAGIFGGLLFVHSAQYIKADMAAAVADLLEEQAEFRHHQSGRPVPALQVRMLSVTLAGAEVLRDIEFDLLAGETVAVLGTNGAGKTTLLRTLSGLEVPDRGVVRLRGRTVTDLDAERRSRSGLVHVRGGNGVFGDLSVGDNLRLAGLRSARDGGASVSPALQATLLHSFESRLTNPADSLSGGEQHMLALAMGILNRPDVLMVDELTLGLAGPNRRAVADVLRVLTAGGCSVLFADQSAEMATQIADRVIVLDQGQVQFVGTPTELLAGSRLTSARFLTRRGKTGR